MCDRLFDIALVFVVFVDVFLGPGLNLFQRDESIELDHHKHVEGER